MLSNRCLIILFGKKSHEMASLYLKKQDLLISQVNSDTFGFIEIKWLLLTNEDCYALDLGNIIVPGKATDTLLMLNNKSFNSLLFQVSLHNSKIIDYFQLLNLAKIFYKLFGRNTYEPCPLSLCIQDCTV